jgi:hypothetical protein
VTRPELAGAFGHPGGRRPGGRRENLRWIVGAVETCALRGPYALVTAGASLHWMATDRALARLAWGRPSRSR